MSVFDPHSPYTNYPAEYRDLLDVTMRYLTSLPWINRLSIARFPIG